MSLIEKPIQFASAVIFLFFLLILTFAPPCNAQPERKVLLLNSYSYDQKWTRSITNAVIGILNKSKGINTIVEFMDTKRNSSSDYYRELNRLYRLKYEQTTFDLVVTSDDNAVNFALKHRPTLFPGVPIVFCGVNNQGLPNQSNFSNITGALEVPAYKDTVELIKKLHPDLKKLYIINESYTMGKSDRQNINNLLKQYSGSFEAVWLEDYSDQKLQTKLSSLEKESAVLLLSFFPEEKGKTFTLSEGAEFVSKYSTRPVYSMWDYFLSRGIVGGMLTSGTFQGITAAEMALQILNGKNPDEIKVRAEAANQYMFDYAQLEKFKIKNDLLPPKSNIVNKPSSLLLKYRIHLSIAVLVIFLLIGICLALIISIRARRKAEQNLAAANLDLSSLVNLRTNELAVLKKTESALRTSEQQFKDLFESSPLALWEEDLSKIKSIVDSLKQQGVTDLKTHFKKNPAILMTCLQEIKVICINSASVKLHDAIDKTELRTNLDRTFTDKSWDIFGQIIDALARGNCHFSAETTLKKISGEVISVLLYLNIICGYEQSWEKVLITFVDITEKRKYEEAIIQAEKMMSVGGLAAGMAHEINNPLGIIMGFAHNMQNRIFGNFKKNKTVAAECGIDLEQVRSYLKKREIPRMINGVQTACERAATIVQNMLSFSRKSDASFEPTDLANLLDQTIELAGNDYSLKKNYDFKKISIHRNYQPKMPPVYCDSNEIQQVFFNLLKNGAEAMFEKDYQKSTPRFNCRVYLEQDAAVVEITDNGPGIKDEIKKRLFEPFFTTKKTGKGTGLGLSVSYFIITEQHKGSMFVDSHPGRWTKFTITIPVHQKKICRSCQPIQ